jgi:hypothetical protein
MHFKDGNSSFSGGAIETFNATLILQSCIFSNCKSRYYGGAITYDGILLTVQGCTFYGNSTNGYGGAIYQKDGTSTLTGNIFYGNTVNYGYGNVIYRNYGSTATSGGYNVYDTTSTNFEFDGTGDLSEKSLSFSTETFMPFESYTAARLLPDTLPTGYPAFDFYGVGIVGGGAAGAVQIPAPVENVTLNTTVLTLETGEAETLIATVTPVNAIQSVTWNSSNTNVATVVDGVVTAVSVGTTTITATSTADSTKKDSAVVTVIPPAVESITLNKTDFTLTAGETETIIATVTPANAIQTVTWSSSNTDVATIVDGVVTAVSVGTAIITATSTADTTMKASVTVTVVPDNTSITINNIIPKNKGIEVYPNPVSKDGVLTIEVPSGTQKVLLYDVVGHLLQTYPLSNNSQETLQLPVMLPHGIYVLRAGGRMCKFVVIE